MRITQWNLYTSLKNGVGHSTRIPNLIDIQEIDKQVVRAHYNTGITTMIRAAKDSNRPLYITAQLINTQKSKIRYRLARKITREEIQVDSEQKLRESIWFLIDNFR